MGLTLLRVCREIPNSTQVSHASHSEVVVLGGFIEWE